MNQTTALEEVYPLPAELYGRPVYSLELFIPEGFSVNAFSRMVIILKKNNIMKVDQLLKLSERELRKIEGIGEASISALFASLESVSIQTHPGDDVIEQLKNRYIDRAKKNQ